MNNYKISVIMPIYNAEEFLKRSVNSIIKQSIGFENIELILVNDNSTDNSKEIMERYSKEYPNIKSFHSHENHGYPGYGRNIGLENSTAEYIMFIDNDDEYDESYCEIMLNTIHKEECDVVCANFTTKFKNWLVENSCYSKIINEYVFTSSNNKLVNLDKIDKLSNPEVWTKIFKNSIIKNNNIKFIENGLNEDALFLYEYYLHAEKLVYIDYFGYIWYHDQENLSKYSSKSTLEFIDSYYKILDFVEYNYENFDYNNFYKGCVEGTIIRTIYSDNQRKILKELYKFERKIEFEGELNHKWLTMINNLLLKERYTLIIVILFSLKVLKKIFDFIRRIIYKKH